MNQNERDRQPRRPEEPRGIGSEDSVRGHTPEDDSELQREGNLGNERNRNQPDRKRERDDSRRMSER